jgi:hypothetical protein
VRDYDSLCKEVETLRGLCRQLEADVVHARETNTRLTKAVKEADTIIDALIFQIRGGKF